MTTQANDQTGQQIFNVPNQLTAARLVISIVLFVLLSLPTNLYIPALILFVIAAGTDWIDGYWARKYDQVTQLGRILDPFVDKILICGTFILLAAEDASGIAPWMAVVVVGREILVTALRGFMEQQGSDFSANMAGKLKMVFQCVAVVISLVVLHLTAGGVEGDSGEGSLLQWLSWPLVISVWLAVISTVYSGAGYVMAVAKDLRA